MQSAHQNANATTQSSIEPQSTSPSGQFASSQTIAAAIIVMLPVLVLLAVFGYRKYRAVVWQHQIRTLEKIWQLSPERKKN